VWALLFVSENHISPSFAQRDFQLP
jgi:hypothetical protein